MAIKIEVIATRDRGEQEVKVTEGLFTFVALDEQQLKNEGVEYRAGQIPFLANGRALGHERLRNHDTYPRP